MAYHLLRTLDNRPLVNENTRFFNRELSWLEFNQRVLEEALSDEHPLLERVKFLSIFSTNLDEFFMIRVAGIKQQIAALVTATSRDGMTPTEQLLAIRHVVIEQTTQQRNCWLDDLKPKLQERGVSVLDYVDLNEAQRAYCKRYFEQTIFPVLTPLAFDMSHPFPHISNLSLNLAVVINDPEEGHRFARVKVPSVIPRLLPLDSNTLSSNGATADRRYSFVWIDQVIAEHIGALFPGFEVVESYAFRITRNADMEIQEEEAADLLRTIQQGLQQRRFGASVRISVEQSMPQHLRTLLLANLKLTPSDLFEMRGPLGLSDLMQLTRIDRPDLKDPPFYAHVPAILQHAQSSGDIFAAIRQQDILLHHPYDSFQPVVDLIEAAAEDPNVLAIKQTLYRVGSNSPIVKALMKAREQDKQVTVLVELKARFDEENNITWARALERAGVHVVYGLVGLKTHAKIALIVRREGDGIRRYVHLGTGNYNAATARIYTDFGLLTCNPEIGADASDIFNLLTGYSRQRQFRKLFVAPVSLREGLKRLIEREIEHVQNGEPGHLIFKTNAVVDPGMIDLLYRASQAGVKIDLLVRGICCLRPGAAGLSENITVRSVIGRFLEHSRIYYAYNAGNPELYFSSADLMQRNLDRRVETLFPIEDPVQVEQIRQNVLAIYLRDTVRTHILQENGSYVRPEVLDANQHFDCQAYFAAGHDLDLD
jgi:polyphosphate kinase